MNLDILILFQYMSGMEMEIMIGLSIIGRGKEL